MIQSYANLHMLPIYQKKIAYGQNGYPWVDGDRKSAISYEKSICPNAEKLHEDSMMGILFCAYEFSDHEVDLTARAFQKVWGQLADLK